ncbi:hypothetical protein [Pseudonocardia thermophila]|uniref:hypothetical protein n=1 Tax=Pseudonocardia thermophila TaxID=1848 RepID=UPI00248E68AE|nr:hypothetical protein [Pseudonocardia thermophila]
MAHHGYTAIPLGYGRPERPRPAGRASSAEEAAERARQRRVSRLRAQLVWAESQHTAWTDRIDRLRAELTEAEAEGGAQ